MENASKALIIAGAILLAILLITIGIVLVNSGSGVADTGTANMNTQKIQTFNAQFTAYEGTKKGADIRRLINLVNASNASDSEHQVTLVMFYNQSISDIVNSKDYTVSIRYYNGVDSFEGPAISILTGPQTTSDIKSENGYIYYIYIDPYN